VFESIKSKIMDRRVVNADGSVESELRHPAEVVMTESGKPKTYARRWFVMLSIALSYASWNMHTSRQVIIAPTYAKWFDIPNESFSSDGVGVDFMSVLDSLILLFSYFPASYVIDRYGMKMSMIGAFAIALSSWIWYASGHNYTGVLIGRSIASVLGPTVSSCVLATSNRWFPENERAIATAIISLFSLLGSGAALLSASPFYTTDYEIVDITLKSCDTSTLSATQLATVIAATSNGTNVVCDDAYADAKDAFCCYQPTDIPTYNLMMAIIPTFTFFLVCIFVRNSPPTPPSTAALKKDHTTFVQGTKILFGNERFLKLAISDFIVSGPPLVLYSSISRVFPADISGYSFIAAAIGVVLAIPTAIVVAFLLDRYSRYYTFTAGGYTTGTFFWIIAMICYLVDTTESHWGFFTMVIFALCVFIAWQTAVYETKLEYVFSPEVFLEGMITGWDRAVINCSNLVFVSSLAPEVVGSAKLTFIIGAVIMVIGCLPVLLIKQKTKYQRLAYEQSKAQGTSENLAV